MDGLADDFHDPTPKRMRCPMTFRVPRPAVFAMAVLIVGVTGMGTQAAEKTVPVTFSGGHETDPKDGGRPVVLVAAGLGVKPEVFREAFRGVTPARDGRPTPEQARKNKEALLKVLG